MSVSSHMTRWGRLAATVSLVAFAASLVPAHVGSQAAEQPLPTRAVVVVDSPERALYRVAIPTLRGDATLGAQGAEVVRNDLKLVSLFEVLNPSSFLADPAKEGLGIDKAAWSSVGAQGVVKGELRRSGTGFQCEMRFYEIARGTSPLLTRTYNGGADQLRGWMHDFANEILQLLTGKRGVFGTRLTFARRVGPGRKDIYVSDFDGQNQGRVSSGVGNAMLPTFGPGGVWYSILSTAGMFITNTAAKERPIITGNGLNMGASLCGGRAYFSSTRDGNSEIYSSSLSGTDVRRLTNNPAIDVSPTCGPGGQIAFVSSRHGGPQVFVMSINGGEAKRVTYKGDHNQTPSFCRDPSSPPLIAFSGRDGSGFDIFTVNLNTGAYTRLTQGQGVNQDPAFSPDCRMIAFASSRGGIFISNPEGLNQNKVISGTVSTVRWSR